VSPGAIISRDEWHVIALSHAPGWARLLSLMAAAMVVALALRERKRGERIPRAVALVILRIVSVGAALVLFFQPALRLANVARVPNHVAVLVDASESMSLAERKGDPTRADRAAKTLAKAKTAFERMSAEHRFDFYTFSGSGSDPGAVLQPTSEIEATTASTAPMGEATHIEEALAAIRTRYDARDLGGVILLSDGIDNGRLAEGGVAGCEDLAHRMDAPIHTVAVGRPGLRDVAIARVDADDFAFVRTALKIEAVVRVIGAKEAGWVGQALPVTLRRDGFPVRTTTVLVEDDKEQYRVEFEFTPDRVGKYLYDISTPVLPGEVLPGNNVRTFLIKVIRDKVRVLQVAGRPSWDERFLRGLLKHDPNVDLISFFILRTPTDIEMVGTDEMSLIPFPTEELFQEQLRSFDVVLLQNFNYAPYGIGAYLGEIGRYVQEGGALAMIGGDLSFDLGGYAHTPIADVLPVELLDLPARSADRLADPTPFRMKLTPEGRAHPMTALKLDLDENEARWGEMPELNGSNLVARARPGATVLGVHPIRRGTDGRPLPVLTIGEAGKGRVLALTTDSSWRWSFGAPTTEVGRGHAYQRFWESAVRWMIRDPALSFLRIETDQAEYHRGQKAAIEVRALGPDYQPLPGAEVQVVVTSQGERPEPVLTQGGKTDESGTLHLQLEPPHPGGYRITARATLSGRPTEEEEVFLVRGAGRELEQPEARQDLLSTLARASGGRFLTADDTGADLSVLSFLEPRIERVNRQRDVELWAGWWTLAIGAGAFALSWFLRRRWGYL
jgi:uncharacterized membrane protein